MRIRKSYLPTLLLITMVWSIFFTGCTQQNANMPVKRIMGTEKLAFLKRTDDNIVIKSIRAKKVITYKKEDSGFYFQPNTYVIDIKYDNFSIFDRVKAKYLLRFEALPNHDYEIRHGTEGFRGKIWLWDLTSSKKVGHILATFNGAVADELIADNNSYYGDPYFPQQRNIYMYAFFGALPAEIIYQLQQ